LINASLLFLFASLKRKSSKKKKAIFFNGSAEKKWAPRGLSSSLSATWRWFYACEGMLLFVVGSCLAWKMYGSSIVGGRQKKAPSWLQLP